MDDEQDFYDIDDLVNDEDEDEDGVGLEEDEEDDNEEDDDETQKTGTAVSKFQEKRFLTGSDRRSLPIMTKFEYSSVVARRAAMLEKMSAPQNIDSKVLEIASRFNVTDVIDLAIIELEISKVEIDIHREVYPGVFEIWNVSELALPSDLNHSKKSNIETYMSFTRTLQKYSE